MSSKPVGRPRVQAVLRGLRALATDIDQLDQFAANCFGVNRTDLRGIELLGASRTTGPTALAAALHMTTAGVTSVIDRLERAGYARRCHDLHDRRKVVVDATDLLIRREQEVFGELQRRLEQLALTYTDTELEIVQDFLERTRQLVVSTYQGQAPAVPPQREREDEQASIKTAATPCA